MKRGTSVESGLEEFLQALPPFHLHTPETGGSLVRLLAPGELEARDAMEQRVEARERFVGAKKVYTLGTDR